MARRLHQSNGADPLDALHARNIITTEQRDAARRLRELHSQARGTDAKTRRQHALAMAALRGTRYRAYSQVRDLCLHGEPPRWLARPRKGSIGDRIMRQHFAAGMAALERHFED